ncbi:hypothetical protein CK203_109545 [Vitis vinifera]|uniref:Uncharacterized protein n=1 Tax=Vitis vinifera TaxID=29760 RepID=A0A438FKI4_VITVI|nr:hypothetical protein CK203_109545 [Vitis vinifera]
MTEVGSVSTTTVAPASSKQSIKRIEFTPWELQFTLIGPIQKGSSLSPAYTPTATLQYHGSVN